jgi:hypothetical protein
MKKIKNDLTKDVPDPESGKISSRILILAPEGQLVPDPESGSATLDGTILMLFIIL